MSPVMQLDDIPPLRVALPFFLTAPLFGATMGALWLVDGDADFALRWTQGMLAATHLFTLGFLAMVMLGALFQVVPVLGGGAIAWSTRIGPVVHLTLTGGALALARGLYADRAGWIVAGLCLLGLAFGLFVPLLALRLLRRLRFGDALYTVRFAVLALLVTLGLGVVLALGSAFPDLGIPFRDWTNMHAAFGLGGWVLLLIMGVSYQVVPMFYVTPAVPKGLQQVLAPLLFVGLVWLGLARQPGSALAAASLVAFAGITYALCLLVLLVLRRRRRAEPAVRSWQVGLLFLIASLVYGAKVAALPEVALFGVAEAQQGMLLAVLFGLGCVTTVVFGMLAKIVPFLAFTHLQRRVLKNMAMVSRLPAMNQIIGDGQAWAQLGLHLLAVAGAMLAVLRPEYGRVCGGVVMADFLLCFCNVAMAAWRYRRALAAIGP